MTINRNNELSFRLFFTVMLILLTIQLNAQPLYWYGKPKPYKWMVGIGWNAVDDDGRPFCQPFDVQQSWNVEKFPTRLNVDRYIKKGLIAEFAAAYTTYKPNKLINGKTGLSGMFISVDFNCKYSFYNLLGIPWYDPYVSLGLGFTHRDVFASKITATGNINLGMNFWIYKNFGVQLQTSGKPGLVSSTSKLSASYMQHSAGIVYKFPTNKRSYAASSKKRYKWTHSKQRYRRGKKFA